MDGQLPGLDTISETLLPRRYQEEILSKALQANVIAALDTGSGKTFISTLLIKWMATSLSGQGKIIVFLVPKVALVEQQGNFIRKHTPLRIRKIYGAMATELSDREGWKQQLADIDVLVMTAQIFLNMITHSIWSIDKVSLLIFDECHHTRKNHAYNGIMREYYQCTVDQRPKIFGMTASPIWNPKDAKESLVTLERNLNATVIAVRDHIEELYNNSPRPKEIIREYPPSSGTYAGYPTPTLWSRVLDLPRSPEIDIPWQKIDMRYRLTLDNLGPFGAELFLYTDLKQRVLQLMENCVEPTNSMLGLHYFDLMEKQTNPDQLPELENILSALSHYDWLFKDDIKTPIDPTWCTPKVMVLVDILLAQYTQEFQGITFVEQRHIASCLARMIPRFPETQGHLKCAELIGHGSTGVTKTSAKGMPARFQRDVVQMFRDHEVNLLVATSVAEEGLDFPACDLVVRFDPLSHLVGYVQSRGRARHHTSTFVIMIEQGHVTQLARYKALRESEPELRRIYEARDVMNLCREVNEEDEPEDPDDIASRERYVIPSTGAILTYNTGVGLLNHLCSLIPRDIFTPAHLPKYSGDFRATLELPSSLPLPPEFSVFTGPEKLSKKEAKRAVAFMAVKKLHALNVFDDYLLPARGPSGASSEDADGRSLVDVRHVPDMMDVLVREPWAQGGRLFLHVVRLDGIPSGGLITASLLPTIEMICDGVFLSMDKGNLVHFDENDEWRQRRMILDYTRMGLWWCVTIKGISLPLTCSLVPITASHRPDFETIERALLCPYGSHDWSGIDERHHNRLLVMNAKVHGRPLLLRKIRRELSPLSVPPPGSREAQFPTYHAYYVEKYTRKGIKPNIPEKGPLLEVQVFLREQSSLYSIKSLHEAEEKRVNFSATNASLLPQGICRWVLMAQNLYQTFQLLPKLMHRVTDLWRAQQAKIELHLPPIHDDLLVEALTLPSAGAGFNNQRFETLGDSVLKLSTVVYLYNKFPHRHEGQLDVLRRTCVSNRTLLAKAKEIGLEHFLTSENQSLRVWRYTAAEDVDMSDPVPFRHTKRCFPRRSLQDCMEAILGASFATAGLSMALRAGTALGLCFGGPVPWSLRYGWKVERSPTPPLFLSLQDALGYDFRCGELLVEAVTHPSFRSGSTPSYQRLEFLGDALVDLVVMRYIFKRFPKADSGHLSWARSRSVCNPALACLAVRKLELHKILLVNNVELSVAISRYIPLLEETSFEEIVAKGWKHDPPKALGDVFESVIGALFVDSGHDFEKTAIIVEAVMEELLTKLSMNLPRDPVSELMIWAAQHGCRRISYRKSPSRPELKKNDSVAVVVHDVVVAGPFHAGNMSFSKGLASEKAREILNDPSSEFRLSLLCDCGKVENKATAVPNIGGQDEDLQTLDDGTEEGFAVLAQMQLEDTNRLHDELEHDGDDNEEEDELNWMEEQAVEEMLVALDFSED